MEADSVEVRWMGGLKKRVARQAHMGQRNGGRGMAQRGVVGGQAGGGPPDERQKVSEWGEADWTSSGAPSWTSLQCLLHTALSKGAVT